MKRSWAMLTTVLLLSSCIVADVEESEKPWEVMEPDEVVDTPTPDAPEPPTPYEASEDRVTYAPGQIPWAKQDHWVVFHRLALAEKNREDGVFGEDYVWKQEGRDSLSKSFDGQWHSIIGFQSYENGTDEIFQPLLGKNGLPITYGDTYFHGVYLPEQLAPAGPPTLHLFETRRGPDEPHRLYKLDPYVAEFRTCCLMIHVPLKTDASDWLECEARRHWSTTNQHLPDKCDAEAGEPGEPLVGSYEAIKWVGDPLVDVLREPHISLLGPYSANQSKLQDFSKLPAGEPKPYHYLVYDVL